MSSDFDADEDWQPPTEAEMKVLQARRERSDRISKLMGDYLLKGYKMLGVCCADCDTILLQDKHGSNYCVACRELDADNVKDDPALSDEAALRQAAEQSQRVSPGDVDNDTLPSVGGATGGAPTLTQAPTRAALYGLQPAVKIENPSHPVLENPSTSHRPDSSHPVQESCVVRPRTLPGSRDGDAVSVETLGVLFGKLQRASVELQQTADVRHCTELCVMVKSCAEAIAAIQGIRTDRH